MSDQTGVRLGVLQEQRLRAWPTARIRPKSVALGVLSLLAEVSALRAERDALALALTASQARADALAVALAQVIEALRPFAHHSLGGWDSRSEREYRIRVTEGQVARAGILLSDLEGQSPDARGTALLEAAEGMAEAFESRRLEPYGNFIARIRAAVDRWRALLGPGGRGAGE